MTIQTVIAADGTETVVDTGQTAGPADPNAPFVQKVYTVAAGLLGLVGIASTFGLITQEQAASLGTVSGAVTGLAGAVVAAIASFRTKKQVKNGTFNPVVLPALPTISTADQVVAAVPNILAEAAEKVAEVKKVQDAFGDLLGKTPIVGDVLEDLFRTVP